MNAGTPQPRTVGELIDALAAFDRSLPVAGMWECQYTQIGVYTAPFARPLDAAWDAIDAETMVLIDCDHCEWQSIASQ
jgi:hypothetical protein